MKLIKPNIRYRESFFEALTEFREANEDNFFKELGSALTVPQYISIAKDHEKGKNLPRTWIPYSAYWLIDKDEFIGAVQIRHTLTEHLRNVGGHIGYSIKPSKRVQGYGKKILELTLKKAKKLGIDKALITCDETNIGSKKVIEANEGILEKASWQGTGKPKKLLYWVET